MVKLKDLMHQQFNKVVNTDEIKDMQIGSFVEWDSLSHYSFLVLIEETYNVEFSVEEMADLKNIKAIADALEKRGVSEIF